jgi:hypothetical protein
MRLLLALSSATVLFGLLASSADARLHLSRHKSFCRQDFIVENVDVGVYFKNTGTRAVKVETVAPIRYYTNGQRVLSVFKDPMVDIKVPADGRWHLSWHSYSVGEGKVIDHCTVKIDAPGFNRNRELLILD